MPASRLAPVPAVLATTLGLVLAAALPLPSAAASAPGPQSAAASEMTTLGDDVTYRLTPRLADMLGQPVDTVLAGDGLRALTAASSPAVARKGTPAVGTTRMWPALDEPGNGGQPEIYLKSFTLRAIGKKIEVWVASGFDDVSSGTAFPAGDVRNTLPRSTDITDAQAQDLVREFDERIYPKETAVFSTPPDRSGVNTAPGIAAEGLDFTGDGDRTVTLVDNVRDGNFYDFAANSTYVAGFFTPLFNQITDRNVMTIDAFDWLHRTGANPADGSTDNPITSRPAKPRSYEGVFAHEWQHLLQSYTDPNETTWVDEGLSNLAISLIGYADTRRGISQPGAESHLYCFQGYGEVEGPSNPDPGPCGGPQNSLTAWEDEGSGAEVLADYGNAWSFLLFLYDRYGTKFIRALHRDGSHQGLAGVQAALNRFANGTKVADVLHDYQLMNLVDRYVDAQGGKIEGISRDRVTTESLDVAVNLASPSAFGRTGVAPNGADYVVLRDTSNDAPLRSLTFSGARRVGEGPGSKAVANWHVSVVGIDTARDRVLVRSFDKASAVALTERDLTRFNGYDTTVAVISHDDPSEAHAAGGEYAGYTLTTNGSTTHGA